MHNNFLLYGCLPIVSDIALAAPDSTTSGACFVGWRTKLATTISLPQFMQGVYSGAKLTVSQLSQTEIETFFIIKHLL